MTSVFDRFPSAQDLLSRPVLRRLTQTLDRQIVTGRVKQYLGELRSQFEQASSEGKFPSMTGLAERIARWIAEREELGPRVVINATGDLFHAEFAHAPLAEAACTAMAAAALAGVFTEQAGSNSLAATEQRLASLVGAEAVCVCNNLSAAVAGVFASQFAHRRVLVRRGDVIELADGMRLSELAELHRVELAEVGAANRVRLDDFSHALQTEACGWLRLGAESSETGSPPLEIAQVRTNAPAEFLVVEVLTQATVTDWSSYGLPQVPVVEHRLQAGADLVLFPADRWLGGPAVGVVAGKKSAIEKLRMAADRFALAVDPIRAAGLDAAVRMYDDPAAGAAKHPLLSLLAASPENLRNRASRIVPQLAALAGVADALVLEAEARQQATPGQRTAVPTFRVKVIPRTKPVEEVRRQLATHPQFSVLPVEASDELLFDLRSVHARYDAELVARISEVFASETETTAEV